ASLGNEARRSVPFANEVRVDDLDGDGASESRLLGAVDTAHAADPDELEDHVSARQRPANDWIVRLRRDLADGEPAGRTELMLFCAIALALRTSPHTLAPNSGRAKLSCGYPC